MFKYVTTTIINSNVDFSTGLPLWSSQVEDAEEGVVGSFNIKRHLKFLKPNVVAIYKAEAYDPTYAKAIVDMASITQDAGVFRIAMYIRLSGSQNSYYSNDFVFKGKPLYIEFEKKEGDTSAKLATKVAAIAKKYMSMVYEKEIVKVTANGDQVVIDGTDEHQLFTKCELQWYNPDGGFNFCCNTAGAYETIAVARESTDPEYDTKNQIIQGKQGFGTYNWLLHNFRLPTAANTRWDRIIQDETPILGAKYNEYIIEYCVDRGILGSDAVGDLVRSKTQHVFYVKQDIAAQFETGLQAIGGITDGRTGNTLVEKAMSTAEAALTKAAANEKALANKQDKLTAGNGIAIADNAVSVKLNGDTLTADASGLKVADQTVQKAEDAMTKATANEEALESKQDKLTAGNGIDITSNKVSVKLNGDTLTADESGLKVSDNKFQPVGG